MIMHIRIRKPLSGSIAAVCMLGTAALGFARETLPIVDTHVHYNVEARAVFDVRAVFEKFHDAGVIRAFVSSTPDDGTLALYEGDRARIVPILRPYRSPTDRADWWRQDAVLEYVLTRLQRDVYGGIGEFHLWDPAQTKTVQLERLVHEAVRRNLIMHVHSDADPIRALYAVNPGVKILWAHAGMSAEPETIGRLLEQYPGLWIEVSLRAQDIAPAGQLAIAWRDLFLRYPARFMIGSDLWTTSRWSQYADIIAEQRGWLAQLPREVAEQIAFRNAVRLISVQE